ncbi:hypothetical protein [Falsarthrobacter nasiphocae]|uniref:Uncharacterized protein n=1 Tax=Falsarthrobacter nasiphocae TaxID=189863 RepID=A0AAE3YGY7_9MICC|nr:hypothetical protein [Falsarthrobacter nasiphocae]MDR6892092.1 hypothetical protein [Falsarthrobacter nasiphocae]
MRKILGFGKTDLAARDAYSRREQRAEVAAQHQAWIESGRHGGAMPASHLSIR